MQNEQLRELALFAGAGGGILGGHLLGWRTVCAVEFAAYPRSVLLARQRDGMLPKFPVWDDVRTFDGTAWRGSVDVISGGFPCQDISVAGKGDGLDGERSGLWSEMARIIGEVQPRFAFVENSPMLTSRGLDKVLGDLSTLGYDAEWGVVGADDAGAPHRRERIWIVAYSNRVNAECGSSEGSGVRDTETGSGSDDHAGGPSAQPGTVQHPIGQLADPDVFGRLHGQAEERTAIGGIHAQREPEPSGEDVAHAAMRNAEQPEEQRGGEGQPDLSANGGELLSEPIGRGGWWSTEPGLGRVAHGVARRVDRLKAIGNGQVPHVAALAWNTLYARIQQRQRTNQQLRT
jgi:DNA (cytosine-5)-methyltransferase 1